VQRFAEMSYQTRIQDCGGIMRKMCDLELKIFNYGRAASNDFKEYRE
jgi:hypothetical protein